MKNKIIFLAIFVCMLVVINTYIPLIKASTSSNPLPAFGLGVSALPDETGLNGWMPDTKIAWDYAYQYLAGGANTGNGWETWGANGTFALNYAKNAESKGYIPVFSYYNLYPSRGGCSNCSEAEHDLSRLNNVATMKSYYENFTLLMKRLGSETHNGIEGYGKQVIVHIEPDLSGFAQHATLNNTKCYGYCTGQGNDPALLKTAVNSTGLADLSSIENTYKGFNLALLKLRDMYAPNVLLAYHINGWSTNIDINSDTRTTVDAEAVGNNVATFAIKSGSAQYDLIFNDVLDRDAGYFKDVLNQNTYWWDQKNVSFPNFNRWEQFISAIHTATGKSIIVWQIPEGNQYFKSVNNSHGHYQDNRAEYFFNHIEELKQAGIIGLLFGAGNAGSTYHYDYKKDGVTNGASFCTTDGMSRGQICNDHQSEYADDDGGYIRIQAEKFYGKVIPPQTVDFSVTSNTVSPVRLDINKEGILKTIIANNSSIQNNIIIDIEVYDATNILRFQKVYENQSFAENASKTYLTNLKFPTSGNYTVKVGIFNSNWSKNYLWVDSALTFGVSTLSEPSATPTVEPTFAPTIEPTMTMTPTPTSLATPSAIEIWWPTNTATISGIQPFKAVINSRALNTYTMWWQVDNGTLNSMTDIDASHKEAHVNVNGWNWRGNGPYAITIVAKDSEGVVITTKTVNVTIAR